MFLHDNAEIDSEINKKGEIDEPDLPVGGLLYCHG
jgi:hypothetical protein